MEETLEHSCVTCGNRLAAGAVICINCGTDQRTGKALQTQVKAPRRRVTLLDLIVGIGVLLVLGLLLQCSRLLLREQDRRAHMRAMAAEPRNVLASQKKPHFLYPWIRLSLTPGGRPLPTIGEVAAEAPSWIENDLDQPDTVAIPASWAGTTIYFSGPVAAGDDLVGAMAGVKGADEIAGGKVTKLCEYSREADGNSRPNRDLPAPFRFLARERRYEVPLEGSLVAGQAFADGTNVFTCVARGARGDADLTIQPRLLALRGTREVPSAGMSVLYTRTAPQVELLPPLRSSEQLKTIGRFDIMATPEERDRNAGSNRIVQAQIALNAKVRTFCGLKRAHALLDGAVWPLDPDGTRLARGDCQIKLAGKPSQGFHDVGLVVEDLAGNVSTSRTVSFFFLPEAVTLNPTLRQSGTNLLADVVITGINGTGALPAVHTLLQTFGHVPVSNLLYVGTSAILTNWPVRGRNGHNSVTIQAGISVFGPGREDLLLQNGMASIYVNRLHPDEPPALPSLGIIQPETKVLYGDRGVYTFDRAHPFWASYGDADPGVDVARVQVFVQGATGAWQEITDQFEISAVRAQLKPGGSFRLQAAHPQIKLLVPEKNYPTPAEFIQKYEVLDNSQKKLAQLQAIRSFLLVQGQTKHLQLEGRNLSRVKEFGFRSAATNGFSQHLLVYNRLHDDVELKSDEPFLHDSIKVVVQPPAAGAAHIYLDGVKQAQPALLILPPTGRDTPVMDVLDKLQDVNGDGIIDARDLDSDGDGLPDISAVVRKLAAMIEKYPEEVRGRTGWVHAVIDWYPQLSSTNDQRVVREALRSVTYDRNADTSAAAEAALKRMKP